MKNIFKIVTILQISVFSFNASAQNVMDAVSAVTKGAQAVTEKIPGIGWNEKKAQNKVRIIKVELVDTAGEPLAGKLVTLDCSLNRTDNTEASTAEDSSVVKSVTNKKGIAKFKKAIPQSQTCIIMHGKHIIKRIDFWAVNPDRISYLHIYALGQPVQTKRKVKTQIHNKMLTDVKVFFYVKGKRKKARNKTAHLTCLTQSGRVVKFTKKTNFITAGASFKEVPYGSDCFVEFEMKKGKPSLLGALNLRETDHSIYKEARMHINIPGDGSGGGDGGGGGPCNKKGCSPKKCKNKKCCNHPSNCTADADTGSEPNCDHVPSSEDIANDADGTKCTNPNCALCYGDTQEDNEPEDDLSQYVEVDPSADEIEVPEWLTPQLKNYKFGAVEYKFPQNGHTITGSVPDLDEVGILMSQYESISILIEGYTNSDSSEEYNLKLSKRRCEAMRTYLLSNYKIDPSRIEIQAYGETQLVYDENGVEDKEASRRVEIKPFFVEE